MDTLLRKLRDEVNSDAIGSTDNMTENEKQEPGLYISLYNGRRDPNDEEIDETILTVVIGPVDNFVNTYTGCLKFEARNNLHFLRVVEDMVYFNGIYYADVCAFAATPHEVKNSLVPIHAAIHQIETDQIYLEDNPPKGRSKPVVYVEICNNKLHGLCSNREDVRVICNFLENDPQAKGLYDEDIRRLGNSQCAYANLDPAYVENLLVRMEKDYKYEQRQELEAEIEKLEKRLGKLMIECQAALAKDSFFD